MYEDVLPLLGDSTSTDAAAINDQQEHQPQHLRMAFSYGTTTTNKHYMQISQSIDQHYSNNSKNNIEVESRNGDEDSEENKVESDHHNHHIAAMKSVAADPDSMTT